MFNEQKEMGKTKWADENIPQEVFFTKQKSRWWWPDDMRCLERSL